MIRIITTLLIIAYSVLTPPPASAKRPSAPELAIFVLIENGGSVTDTKAAKQTTKHLLGQLTTLKRRRATKNAQIYIILSALPNRITWSGTPQMLLDQASDVLKLVTFKPTFNDLVLAFNQINTTVQLTLPDEYRLYWIGPTIHVPFSTSNENVRIKVPQEIPVELKFSELALKASVVKLYGVHPDQDEILLKHIIATGIRKRARTNKLDFELMGPAPTAAHLKDLL
jgi:hypothetical protein